MKNIVHQLKKKHRDYIWKDEEGDYWYWDSIKRQWLVILADFEAGFYRSDRFDPAYYDHFVLVGESALITERKDLEK